MAINSRQNISPSHHSTTQNHRRNIINNFPSRPSTCQRRHYRGTCRTRINTNRVQLNVQISPLIPDNKSCRIVVRIIVGAEYSCTIQNLINGHYRRAHANRDHCQKSQERLCCFFFVIAMRQLFLTSSRGFAVVICARARDLI